MAAFEVATEDEALTRKMRKVPQMIFAHWKNVIVSQGVITGPNGQHRREAVPTQSGPGDELGPIQFIDDIPEGTKRDDVVASYMANLLQGLLPVARIDDETEQIGFEEEWPPDVRSAFDLGYGDRWSWSSLK